MIKSLHYHKFKALKKTLVGVASLVQNCYNFTIRHIYSNGLSLNILFNVIYKLFNI